MTDDPTRAALADAIDAAILLQRELAEARAQLAERDGRLAAIKKLAAMRSASGGINAARMRKIEAIAKGE